MNKSTKLVSLFLSTAIVLSTVGCGNDQKVVYDQNGNPIVIQDDDNSGGFFAYISRPFGFHISTHTSSYNTRAIPSSGSSGSSGNSITSSTSSTSSAPESNTGISGVSPWGMKGSTSSSSGSGSSSESSSSGGTGISSGSHGGIGGGESSAS